MLERVIRYKYTNRITIHPLPKEPTMLNTDLLNTLRDHNIITATNAINKQAARMIGNLPAVYQQLMESTSFLDKSTSIRARIVALRSGITEAPVCKTCGKATVFNNATGSFNTYCPNTKGRSCASGDPVLQKQIKQTNMNKYGHENPMSNHELQERRMMTVQERYGAPAPILNPAVREAYTATLQERYGVSTLSDIPGISERRKATNNSKYGADTYAQGLFLSSTPDDVLAILNDKDRLMDLIKDFSIDDVARTLSVSVFAVRKQLDLFGMLNMAVRRTTSSHERRIASVLDAAGVQYSMNDRSVISPKELDFYIPSHKLAIEVNGVYFHSELAGRGRRYHSDKTISCNNAGIRLMQIWSNEWDMKQNIVISRIRNALGISDRIYARKCTIVPITSSAASVFLTDNHIQGAAKSPISYGLIHDDKIVAVMTFSKSRYTQVAEIELVRYCSVAGVSVVGGASKLFQHFIRTHNPSSVVSYCDLRWGTGNLYRQLGFSHLHTSDPNYFYFNKNNTSQLMSRVRFQKHKLANQFPHTYDPLLSEWDNMKLAGYDRIWDCGNDVFVWNKSVER